MITFTILCIALMVGVLVATALIGGGALIIGIAFSDVIACILFIVILVKLFTRKKK